MIPAHKKHPTLAALPYPEVGASGGHSQPLPLLAGPPWLSVRSRSLEPEGKKPISIID